MARWLCLVLIACLSAQVALADYVDGEVRGYLRAGPGLEFRILKILPAGTPVQRVGREGEWIHVRAADLDGWIPDGFVSEEEPASALLPRTREKLVSAEGRITELDQKLSAQTAELEQLSTLRERNQVLEADVSRSDASARWKSLTAGAGILLVGILIGLVAPRGGGTRSRLKL
ncbi:MAG: TIGR04211 family SH3 domain-containing protein [Solirubrobacteraceae bacterium]